MSFLSYVGAFVILIGALAYGTVILHLPLPWLGASALVLAGIAFTRSVAVTR